MLPIKTSKVTVTSKYGMRTITVNGKTTTGMHNGIDIVANPNNRNEDILAFADGTVVAFQRTGAQYGTTCSVRLRHANGLQTFYCHQQSGTIPAFKIGDSVKKGDFLGKVGTTGNSTGVHLHFQIDKGSSVTSVDPWDYLFNGKVFDIPVEPPKSVTPYQVEITAVPSLNIRKGPGTMNGTNGSLKTGEKKMIDQESKGDGASLWGRIQGSTNWIALDFTKKVVVAPPPPVVTPAPAPPPPPVQPAQPTGSIGEKSLVSVKSDAKQYSPGGSNIPSWVKTDYNHIVTQVLSGGKPVIRGGKTCVLLGRKIHKKTKKEEAGINTWIDKDLLTLIK